MQVLSDTPTKAEIILRRGCDWTRFVEVPEDEPLPDDTVVTLYAYPRDGGDPIAFWPAILVEPGGCQFQIYADDHEIIPDGARFLVILAKPGYPKSPWFEGRFSKGTR